MTSLAHLLLLVQLQMRWPMPAKLCVGLTHLHFACKANSAWIIPTRDLLLVLHFQVAEIDPKWLVELAPRFFRAADPHKLSRRKRYERIEPLYDRWVCRLCTFFSLPGFICRLELHC
jgi:hypothetical protein